MFVLIHNDAVSQFTTLCIGYSFFLGEVDITTCSEIENMHTNTQMFMFIYK